jgi:hypothetical protein
MLVSFKTLKKTRKSALQHCGSADGSWMEFPWRCVPSTNLYIGLHGYKKMVRKPSKYQESNPFTTLVTENNAKHKAWTSRRGFT